MESHEDEFSPFVEDDEGFEKYMTRMRKVRTVYVPYAHPGYIGAVE